jgi:phage I-like protein
MTTQPSIASCSLALAATGGAIQIFPAGEFSVPHGAMLGEGPWRLDAASAQRLIARVAARKNPLVIDFEHQTLMSRENGKPAPAAGWIQPDSLEWRDDGLWAAGVEWTADAEAMIQAGQYKFLSPVFTFDPASGAPQDLLNVALTNNPAIDGMSAVAVAAASLYAQPPETPPVNELLDELRECLNLPTAATAADVSAELTKIIGLIQTVPIAGAKATGGKIGLLAAIQAQQAEIAALKSQAPDPARFVPVSAVADLQNQLAAMSASLQAREVDELVGPALTDGRLLPAMEEWARDLGKKDLGALKGYLDKAQPIAALQKMQTGGTQPTAAATAAGLEARTKAEWDGSAALQAEFGSYESYLAFAKADAAGLIKIKQG